ncbi:MAG: gamma-glutamyl-gamma-aminobutyrate hydrolase family protein [Planctomycetota bacterium]|nr:gamma-glutamyl-gamma-aminobutyrate hydrolase family protein [Planctomycetota bacterium]
MSKKPKIILNSNYTEIRGSQVVATGANYCDAVADAGGIPLISACIPNRNYVDEILTSVSGLVLVGSLDIDPKIYGEKKHRSTKLIHPRRQEFDFLLVERALEKRLPILGICGGEQLLNVALGGSLIQHIPRNRGHTSSPKQLCFHKIRIERETLLHQILKRDEMLVNSYHHQAVRKLGKGLVISACSEDGIVEAIEDKRRMLIGVQWHPERETEEDVTKNRLFGWLVAQAQKHLAYDE